MKKRKGDLKSEQTIYGDILFIINFSMDFLALWFSVKITHGKIKPLRMCISAAVGAAYGVAAIFIWQNIILNFISELAAAFVICLIAFGKTRLFRSVITFMMMNLLIGGSMTAVYSLFGTGGIFRSGTTVRSQVQSIYLGRFMPILATGILLAWLCVRIVSYVKGDKTATVEVMIGNKNVKFEALTDSGNLLTEPISGYPVVIADVGVLKPVLTDEEYKNFIKPDYSRLIENNIRNLKIRLLFAHGIGGEKTMIGIIPEGAKINGREKNICIGTETNGTKYGGHSGLVPLCITE